MVNLSPVDNDAKPVRAGEELDTQRLSKYLRSQRIDVDGGLEILQFPAGASNLTYLIRGSEEDYVLRRPPFGNTVKTAHDMRREFDVLSRLSAVYQPAPKPLLFCEDVSVIGSEFYLIEKREGLIIRGRSPETLENSHELQEEVCRSFIQNLADLHALDLEAAGLGEFGKPDGYCKRQVEGWTKRYFAAKTHDHAALERTIAWLNERIPPESGAALIHNDYKFDNVMLDPDDLTRITAVLDWEMVTVGDPLMDLGTTLGYWMSADAGPEMLSMPFNPRALMENISRSELAETYAAARGQDIPDLVFYYVFGTFKIAVIAQQIYARYVKGFTKDPRFEQFAGFVGRLGQIGDRAIERGQL